MKVMSDGYMYGHNCSTDGYKTVLGSGGCETQLNMKRSEFMGDIRESFRLSRRQSQLALQCRNLAQYQIHPVLRYGGTVSLSDAGPSCNTERKLRLESGLLNTSRVSTYKINVLKRPPGGKLLMMLTFTQPVNVTSVNIGENQHMTSLVVGGGESPKKDEVTEVA